MSMHGAKTRKGTALKRSASAKKENRVKLKKGKMDIGFLAVVITLLIIGLLMVFSASYPSGYYNINNPDPYQYIKSQIMWALAGFVAMIAIANFPYKAYRKHVKLMLIVSIILLLAIFTPLGHEANGARRWLKFGGPTMQPSEIVKYVIIVCTAYWLEKDGPKIKKFNYLIKYGLLLCVFFALFLFQPHFSVCIIIGLTMVVMLLAGGAKLRHFLFVGLPVGVVASVLIIIFEPYRLARVQSVLDPFKDAQGDGWQIIQSLYAIGSGGFFGLGFGNSRQKYLYVPEPHNDFIFSIVCEELGFIGAVAILIIFGFLIFRGLKIAMDAPDTFSSMLVTGIISLVAIEVILNILVVTSTIPTTGIPLPFFSFGGTALFFLLAALGIVLNVSRYSKENKL